MLIFELSGITGIWVTNLDKDKKNFHFDHRQWWILGEANEAVGSGPLENSTYSFISLQMFFRDQYAVGTKSGKYKIDSR